MSTRWVQIPIYNIRYPTSVDYVRVQVPRESVGEQRRVLGRKLKDALRIAKEGMKGVGHDSS